MHWFGKAEPELYHLANDIGEQHDRAEQEPQRSAALRAQLQEHLDRLQVYYPVPAPE